MMRARDPEALRAAIRERQLSLRKLGKLADCSRTTPYLLMQGKSTSDDTAARIARALERKVGELFAPAASSIGQQLDKEVAAA